MFRNFANAIKLSVVLALLTLGLGCSSNGNPSTPGIDEIIIDDDYISQLGDNFAGEYTLNLDSESVSGEIVQGERNAALDVTRMVGVSIDGLKWDPVDRIWDIVIRLHNPSSYSAYRPWVVFTSLGRQELLNQDHFVWLFGGIDKPPVRCALKEIDKASPKLFGARSSELVHMRLHWPEDVSSFSSISFFVDVSFPSFRNQPEIASISVHRESSLSSSITIVGRVFDMQSPPQGVARMEAWVDLSSVGCPDKLYLQGIGQSEEGFVVCDVPSSVSGVATLHALDWQGYGIEQDFVIESSSGACQEPRSMGSGLATGKRQHNPLVLLTQEEVTQLWRLLDQPDPAPLLSSSEMCVFLSPGPMSSSSVEISLDCASLDPDSDDDGLDIDWRVADGIDDDCDDADDDFYTPFAFFALPKVSFSSVSFDLSRSPSSCPDGSCVSYREVSSGVCSSSCSSMVEVCNTQAELNLLWRLLGSPGEVPQISSSEACVVVVGEKQPTTGHEVAVRCVSPSSSSSSVHVEYVLRAPDSSCDVEPISSSPFAVVAFASNNPLYTASGQEVTNPLYYKRCSPDSCEPSKVVGEGDDSAIRVPYFDVICTTTSLRAFWSLHRPGLAPPDFDFSSRVLAVVCLGERPSSGFSASLDCVSVEPDPTGVGQLLTLHYTENIPGASCDVNPFATAPYMFVALNRATAFDDSSVSSSSVVYECP